MKNPSYTKKGSGRFAKQGKAFSNPLRGYFSRYTNQYSLYFQELKQRPIK